MEIKPLKIPGTYEISLTRFEDERGYFAETYRAAEFAAAGLPTGWVQENQALSRHKGVLRGLHFQTPPHAQAKLVRVVSGAVWDAFVDLRPGSLTYAMWDAVELSAGAANMVLIPRGFAHGYCTLTPDALMIYRVDAYYSRAHDTGIHWNDPALGIEWPVDNPILSAKDRNLPRLADIEAPFADLDWQRSA